MPILKFIQPPTVVDPRTFVPHIDSVGIRDHDGDAPLAPKARGLKLSGPTPTPGGNPDQIPLAAVDNILDIVEYPYPDATVSDFRGVGNATSGGYKTYTIALANNEFCVVYLRDIDPQRPQVDPWEETVYVQHGTYNPANDQTTMDAPIPVFGGGTMATEDAIPPIPSTIDDWGWYGPGQFGVNPYVVMLDRTHGVLRFVDVNEVVDEFWGPIHANINPYPGREGALYGALVAFFMTFDWEAGTVEFGPPSVVQLDYTPFTFMSVTYDDYNAGDYASQGYTPRMLALPDGRIFHVSADWNYSAPTVRIGRADFDTGVLTWGTKWHHPDSQVYDPSISWPMSLTAPRMWQMAGVLEPYLADDGRVYVWYNAPISRTDVFQRYDVQMVLVFTVNDDDTVTLDDWANVTPDSSRWWIVDERSMIQTRPGQFVLYNYYDHPDLDFGWSDLRVVDVGDAVDHVVSWTQPMDSLSYIDPIYEGTSDPAVINARNQEWSDPESRWLVSLGDGNFVLCWWDSTSKVQFDVFDLTLVYVCSFMVFPNGAMQKGFQSVIAGIPNRNEIPGSFYQFSDVNRDEQCIPAVVHSSRNLDLIVCTQSFYRERFVWDPNFYEGAYRFESEEDDFYVTLIKMLPSC